MTVRLSKVYGMDIFSNDAGFIGKVADVILDMERGEVVRVTTEALKNITREDATKILKEKSILYKRVTSLGDIMIVGRSSEARVEHVEQPVEDTKRHGLRPSARDMLKR